jgi:hypothetical protein
VPRKLLNFSTSSSVPESEKSPAAKERIEIKEKDRIG